MLRHARRARRGFGHRLCRIRRARRRSCGRALAEAADGLEVLADVNGRGYEHAVVLDEGTQISGIFSDVRIERGRSVGLRLEAPGCLVFSGSAAGMVPTTAAELPDPLASRPIERPKALSAP